MQYLKLNRLIIFIVIILPNLILIGQTNNTIRPITLSKIYLQHTDGRYPDVFVNNNFIILHKIGGGEDELIFYTLNNFKEKNKIDLYELGFKASPFLYSTNHSIILISRIRKKDKSKYPELVNINFKGKIIKRIRLKFIPRGLIATDNLICVFGKYKNKVLHIYDNKLRYKKSFISVNKFPLPYITWRLVLKKTGNKIFVSDVEKYKIWVIKNFKLFKEMKFRNDNNLIVNKQFGNKNKMYRNKGIHDFVVYDNKIYVSCFDHSNRKNETWYDVINLDTGEISRTVKTKFLYYFTNYKNRIFIYHNIPQFEIFNGFLN